ncbi:MAG TPA: hypothetical protein ENI23_01165 [bacterium]|nr:hypothetical protein [bacterium]
MTIEKILDELGKDGDMVIILKANAGYSAVLCEHDLYMEKHLIEDHHNGATVLKALDKLIKIYQEEKK